MRVFISADLEGVAGVSRDEQTDPSQPGYPAATRLMAAEVNAAVEGALEAGADGVVVADGHWSCTNLDPESLHPAAELVSGHPRVRAMAAGLEIGFDAALFIGYHASSGTPEAILPHTYADPALGLQVRVNGVAQSEGSLTGMLCGHLGCPLVMLSGDAAAVDEMRRFVPGIHGVVTKWGLSAQAARSLSPEMVRREIRSAAARALAGRAKIPPLLPPNEVLLEMEFAHPSSADSCARIPGVNRAGPRTVAWSGTNYPEAYDLLLALVDLAAAWK
ncbi:MAG: M55 family metallopeptidase [Candidatus Dormibacteraeota bacterium]|nr:M55 family metallopeptidase [Candidatus Dormibacteraeota bacterium]